MSIDDKIEQDVYDAILKITQIPRPKERTRILWEVIRYASRILDCDVESK